MKYLKALFYFLDGVVQSLFDIFMMSVGVCLITLLILVFLPVMIVLYQVYIFMCKIEKEFK